MPAKILPFLLLAVAGLLGLGQLPAEESPEPTPVPTPTAEVPGSVKVTTQLESTHLRTGQDLETYARIALEGVPTTGKRERLPVSLTLVIDRSGSMSGQPMLHAKRAAQQALKALAPGDKASVIAFSNGAEVIVPELVVGSVPLEPALRRIGSLGAAGGTDMAAGLQVGGARAQALAGEGRVNRLLLLSDGQPNTEAGLLDQVRALAQSGVQTTTLGIGRSYNEDLMVRLADAGLGNYYFVDAPERMAHVFDAELKSLAAVVAKEAVVTLSLEDGVEVLEVYGWQVSRGTRTLAVPVGDIYSGRKADILARLRVPASREGEAELVRVKVSYHDSLAGEARKVARALQASFTDDEGKVASSLVPEVANKAQEVRTAQALEQASAALAEGNKDEARRIAGEQKSRLSAFAQSKPGRAYAPAAAQMSADLDDLAEEAEADMESAKKRAKATARSYKR